MRSDDFYETYCYWWHFFHFSSFLLNGLIVEGSVLLDGLQFFFYYNIILESGFVAYNVRKICLTNMLI